MPRILLAEDDDSLRGFLARALERAGYDVTACADGDEAAAVLDQEWDLLLTDIVMPNREGVETIRELRTLDPQTPIIAMSGPRWLKSRAASVANTTQAVSTACQLWSNVSGFMRNVVRGAESLSLNVKMS